MNLRLLPVVFFVSFSCLHAADLRMGIIGTDTSHVIQFAKIFNDPANPKRLAGARITTAFRGGRPDDEPVFKKVGDDYLKELVEKHGVKSVPTIAALVDEVDVILIESVDGRTHLEQAKAVFPAGKPVFIDKPFAGSLRDAFEIARLAREMKIPIFSSSSLRFSPGLAKLKSPAIGELRGAFSYGPAHRNPNHPDLYWYGIHATEALYTVVGMGCESVVRTTTENTDVVTGTWSGGRVGIVYGIRNASRPFGVTAFGTKAVLEQEEGWTYDVLAAEILKFFQTKVSPVPIEETLEIFAFMEAADESKRRGGVPVSLAEVKAMNVGSR